MRILWHNILIAILAIFGAVLLVKSREAIAGFLGTVQHVGPGHSFEEQTVGLIAFGLLGVILVTIVRLLTHNNGKNK